MRLSIIVPVLDEASTLASALARLAPLRERGARVIVVDGGSQDETVTIAAPLADRVIGSARGRAAQMNAGAREALATGEPEVLLFLHADTELPAEADRLIATALASGQVWGRFDVQIRGASPWLRVVARMMNWRSRLTGIATGDQAIFVEVSHWIALGGFAEMPLMEDIELSRRARALSRPACIKTPVITSGRRWEIHGVWPTIWLMWRLRAAYFFGADPARLARLYRNTR
ncbi:MAG: TIGR04283 family arsenosugar biosynthesis glycosyltransferase [Burkholderiaceae bacterium]